MTFLKDRELYQTLPFVGMHLNVYSSTELEACIKTIKPSEMFFVVKRHETYQNPLVQIYQVICQDITGWIVCSSKFVQVVNREEQDTSPA